MTLPLAILLIIILLLYDAVFLRLLLNRKGRVIFSISIEDGKIKETSGKVPEGFYVRIEELCTIHQPGMIKISVIKAKETHQLKFSGTLAKAMREAVEQSLPLIQP